MTATKKSKRILCSRLVFVFTKIFCTCILLLNIGFAQTKSKNTEEEKNNHNTTDNKTITDKNKDQKNRIAVLIKTDNSSSIDPQDEKIRRKAMTMILNISKANNPLINKQTTSIFNLIEQKQKERKKSKREMKAYNQRKNDHINDFFQVFQKKRLQSASYSGKRDDYTSYIQIFHTNSSR